MVRGRSIGEQRTFERVQPAIPEQTSPTGLESYITGTTLISSNGPAWKDLYAQVFARKRVQEPFLVPAVAEPLLVWIMSGNVVVEEREPGGQWTANRVGAGNFFLTRSPTPYEMRWHAEDDRPFQVMHLYLSVPLFEKITREMKGLSNPVTLQEISGGRDPTLSHLLSLLHGELASDSGGDALFVQGLAQCLCVHLVRQYSVVESRARRRSALPGAKLRRAIALLESRLDQPFDLKRLARSAGMSEFHFSRLFKKATGLAPSHYFIRQRVARAQQLLRETEASVIEIGLVVGYSSPSHFAQIFRRETGLSPSDYRGGRGNEPGR